MKEATARIKINKLLEAAGWRFFPDGTGPANIRLEPSVTIKSTDLDALGDNFEKSGRGFVDFLLLDAKGFPLLVLEAKAEDKNPLVGNPRTQPTPAALCVGSPERLRFGGVRPLAAPGHGLAHEAVPEPADPGA